MSCQLFIEKTGSTADLSANNFVSGQEKPFFSRGHAGGYLSLCTLMLSNPSSCIAGCPKFALENEKMDYPP